MRLVLYRSKQVMLEIASNTSGGSRTGTPQVRLPTESDELEERPGALHPALFQFQSLGSSQSSRFSYLLSVFESFGMSARSLPPLAEAESESNQLPHTSFNNEPRTQLKPVTRPPASLTHETQRRQLGLPRAATVLLCLVATFGDL